MDRHIIQKVSIEVSLPFSISKDDEFPLTEMASNLVANWLETLKIGIEGADYRFHVEIIPDGAKKQEDLENGPRSTRP